MNRISTRTIMFTAALLASAGGSPPAHAAEPTAPAKMTASEPVFHPLPDAQGAMQLPFSESVRAGDMLYLSGQIGTDATGKLVTGGIRAETKQLMDNIGAALTRGSSSFDRVVQCTVALVDIKDWPAFNEVYRTYFPKHFPARMAYATTALALGAHAEVQCNAVVSR
ncbi:Rid family hydrolase [Dokdonella soli]|uniref:RidA family protein n=1 Tax=Dokdonella soli TaxID=529810 RepID=A0ABN1ISU3_9GAMM